MHRPPRRAPRPARLRAARRPGARARCADPEAHARAAGAHPRARCCACTSPPRRSPTRCRSCRRPTRGTIAYEIEHISDHEERVWLRQAIESGRYRQPLTADERRALLGRLSRGRGDGGATCAASFLGQKQFSLEGLDVMIPMLDESIELAAEDGAHEVVIGMAHRGRLNVLAHTVGRPYETILREFEGERTIEAVAADPEGGSGDVKYHLGAQGAAGDARRRDRGHARREPEPPRGGRPGRRGTRARRADRPRGGARAPRPERRDAGPDPRRRVVRRPGRRRRDAQPERARRLLDRRHAAPDREQPGRLHDRSRRGPLDALLERPREGLRHPDRPRQRRRPRGGDRRRSGSRWRTGAASATTSSSTSSATGASATTSRTRPPTRSR